MEFVYQHQQTGENNQKILLSTLKVALETRTKVAYNINLYYYSFNGHGESIPMYVYLGIASYFLFPENPI